MSVLLPTDDLELFATEATDDDGWAVPGETPTWTGRGSLQLTAGQTYTAAAFGGGAGPFDPTVISLGIVFLPPEAPAVDGMRLRARSVDYVLAQVRLAVDPVNTGADCLVASVSSFEMVVP